MMTNKEYNRAMNRTAGEGLPWPKGGVKSAAHEIWVHGSPQWRREWIKRGLGRSLRGPVGRLP